MSGYTIFALIFLGIVLWIGYELYTAPIAEESEEHGFRVIKPCRKLSDLFKRKN